MEAGHCGERESSGPMRDLLGHWRSELAASRTGGGSWSKAARVLSSDAGGEGGRPGGWGGAGGVGAWWRSGHAVVLDARARRRQCEARVEE
jgi:hypothetical protein